MEVSELMRPLDETALREALDDVTAVQPEQPLDRFAGIRRQKHVSRNR